MPTRSAGLLAAALAVGLVAAGCGGKRTESPSGQGGATGQQVACEASDGRITIATGNAGGVYYVLGGGLAQLISANKIGRAHV